MVTKAQIVIVGGGPAGARAAELMAREGGQVLLLDPKAPWEKPCGGGLTQAAFLRIPELGELLPRTRPLSQIRIETSAERGFSIFLDEPIRILSRKTLAEWQLDRARAAGAVHLREKVHTVRRSRGHWELVTDRRKLLTELLVGADGAASLVRRAVAPKFHVELAPTRVGYVNGAGPTPDTMVVRLVPSVAGYVWDFPRPDHRSVGIGVQSGAWAGGRMDREIDALRASSQECSCPEVERAGAVIGSAQHGHGDFHRVAGDDFALLGDAAGFADPATGEGILNALWSAELLTTAWQADGSFAAYPSLARAALAREFLAGRIFRRAIFESDTGARLVDASSSSSLAQALVAAIANAVNHHDVGLPSLARRWLGAWRRSRLHPDLARRGERTPAPCHCGCPEEAST